MHRLATFKKRPLGSKLRDIDELPPEEIGVPGKSVSNPVAEFTE
jgi:hypothetical protein